MNVLNLFSGCGGFALGAVQAGFNVIAAMDVDAILSSSFNFNFPNTEFFHEDVSDVSVADLRATINREIHGVIGGPPCQGFSTIGRRNPDDPRSQIVHEFYRIVDGLKPSFFVMENVVGLIGKGTLGILDSALQNVSDSYHVFGPVTWKVSEFGGVTTRPRVFVIGILKKVHSPFSSVDIETQKCKPLTVRHAIADLDSAVYVGEDERFDVWRIRDKRKSSYYSKALHAVDSSFTGHVFTRHTSTVKKRFSRLKEGQIDVVGRHPRLSWNGLCPTLRAGTGEERGSYMALRPIHPTNDRVITVREAARLQGFPDAHRFHPTKWHSFRMIGNSVSPIMGRAILTAIRQKIEPQEIHPEVQHIE